MDAIQIRSAIETALADDGFSERQQRDIAFHMTDWLSDLDAWVAFCRAPNQLPAADLSDLLMRNLIHGPNHVAAASKLMTGMSATDIFGVGVLDDDKDANPTQ